MARRIPVCKDCSELTIQEKGILGEAYAAGHHIAFAAKEQPKKKKTRKPTAKKKEKSLWLPRSGSVPLV